MDRDEFRNSVFARDNHKCVVCGKPAVDAHHIIERRLFPDGGYNLNNGSSLCEQHHLEAEMTILTCSQIRELCGITKTHLPPHLYSDNEYDKWGNILNPDGTRTPGELFEDESVQKILKAGKVLELFTKYRKYPRTYHLPWSPGLTKDDRVLQDLSCFEGKTCIVTEKMDGENTTIYSDGYIHARSLDSKSHPSRTRVRKLASELGPQIPKGWRLCLENLQAKHSILYEDLEDYFLVFAIYNENNECLSWYETEYWCKLLDLKTVPFLYRFEGIPNERELEKIMFLWREGYVIRNQASFHYSKFRENVAKYVRANHVQSTHNWMMQAVIPNKLKVNI